MDSSTGPAHGRDNSPGASVTDEAAPLNDGSNKLHGPGDVLALDHGVKLQFGADEMLVVSGLPRKRTASSLCGIGPSSSPDLTIPFYHLLWAEYVPSTPALVLDYALPLAGGHRFKATQLRLACANLVTAYQTSPGGGSISPESAAEAARLSMEAYAELLLSRAYPAATTTRRIRAKVLINPNAGPGGADAIWAAEVRPIFEAARMRMDAVTTKHGGHGAEIVAAEGPVEGEGSSQERGGEGEKSAKEPPFIVDDWDAVVALSGDGLPHEIFNGLARRRDGRRALAKIAVAHVPCGSGNAMACNLYGSHRPSVAALAIVKGARTEMDLVSVTLTDPETREVKRIVSFLSQSLGIVAESDLATEHLRWMGSQRFTFGLAQRVFGKICYPADIAVKVEVEGKDALKVKYGREKVREEARMLQHRRDEAKAEASSASVGSSSAATTATRNLPRGHAASESSGLTLTDHADAAAGPNPSARWVEGSKDLALPPLAFGTVRDDLPDGWELVPHEKLGNFYCGNMAYMAPDANFFSAACINDGLMDLITIDGDVSPLKAIQMFLSVETGHFFDSPLVNYKKISGYRILPRLTDGYISIDGERVPFGAFQAEVHKGLGTVLSKMGVYQAPGPMNWDKVTMSERLHA